MTPEELRERRAKRRAFTMAPRSEAELLEKPNETFITPTEMALLTKMSVEALMLNRARRKPPIGFRHGRSVRFTMGEYRSLPALLVKQEADDRQRKAQRRKAVE